MISALVSIAVVILLADAICFTVTAITDRIARLLLRLPFMRASDD